MRRACALLLVLPLCAFAGCKRSAEPDAYSGPTDKEFREKVATYLAEARAGAKLLAGDPSVRDVTKKAEKVATLYAGLKDVPPSVDTTGNAARFIKGIHDAFPIAVDLTTSRAEAKKLGAAGEKVEMTAAEGQLELAKSIRAGADGLEKLVRP